MMNGGAAGADHGRENVGITVVLFQALYDYCFEMASVLDHDVVKNIIEGNYTL